ncbi:rRNA maturation RNase YbeY [Flavisolibacter ginsengisoli]|nr:rRNA maturation RNase YbeY [Flavisolibacter ginsengisoli]
MSKVITGQIYFHYSVRPFSFSKRNDLKMFLKRLCMKEGKQVDTINFIFCTDQYLLGLNKKHLNHDTLTDIITFEYNPPGQALLSDIYISIERVRDNAVVFKTSFSHELHRVIFHGVLHLCGYKDKKPEESKLMRFKEEEYLQKWFVPRGTA